jgi:hypothetical protein
LGLFSVFLEKVVNRGWDALRFATSGGGGAGSTHMLRNNRNVRSPNWQWGQNGVLEKVVKMNKKVA